MPLLTELNHVTRSRATAIKWVAYAPSRFRMIADVFGDASLLADEQRRIQRDVDSQQVELVARLDLGETPRGR